MSKKITRQKFLDLVGAGAASIALLSLSGCDIGRKGNNSLSAQANEASNFRSRPDLSPTSVEVTTRADGMAPGYIFEASKKGAGQDGPMILDDHGQLVWFSKGRYATDFRVQTYRGRPVLTWWQGSILAGHGVGEYFIYDDSYQEIARFGAANGQRGDLHEFNITPQDTALITSYVPKKTDLSAIGGPEDGMVWEGTAQEIDIETGELLFEWRSLDHVGVEESYYDNPPDDPSKPLDYFHINSLEIDLDKQLLISAKGTCAVYKVDRATGDILWRLGGKKSDFDMGPGTRTAFQHDARRQSDGTITIFDNGAPPKVHDQSRGIVVKLDMDEMSATLVREFTHPNNVLSTSQGNVQVLPNSNVFIGWGSEPYISEYTHDGKLLFDARFVGDDQSYRAYRLPWSGHPGDDPAVAVERGSGDKVTLYASWNGATEVESWQVLAGSDPDNLKPVGSAPRRGFEISISVRTSEPYLTVQAKNESGRVLGTAKTVKLEERTA